jgi:hypothetical protein
VKALNADGGDSPHAGPIPRTVSKLRSLEILLALTCWLSFHAP